MEAAIVPATFGIFHLLSENDETATDAAMTSFVYAAGVAVIGHSLSRRLAYILVIPPLALFLIGHCYQMLRRQKW